MKASDFFHKEDNLNCAQAVLRYFGADEKLIAEYKAFGGGRAPEGICGALYAAKTLLNDDRKFAALCEKFSKESNGVLSCKDIKAKEKISCPRCVDLAGELLEKFGKQPES